MSAGSRVARLSPESTTVSSLVAQRHVVLELLDADALVDVPGASVGSWRANRLRPTAGRRGRYQRHWSDHRFVAGLASAKIGATSFEGRARLGGRICRKSRGGKGEQRADYESANLQGHHRSGHHGLLSDVGEASRGRDRARHCNDARHCMGCTGPNGRNLDQSVVQEPCRLGRFHARWELFRQCESPAAEWRDPTVFISFDQCDALSGTGVHRAAGHVVCSAAGHHRSRLSVKE